MALVHLVARLIAGGYQLLDTQFQTEHLSQFGTSEVERKVYRQMLSLALDQGEADWQAAGYSMAGRDALALIAAYAIRQA